jgi:hypothetical protein
MNPISRSAKPASCPSAERTRVILSDRRERRISLLSGGDPSFIQRAHPTIFTSLITSPPRETFFLGGEVLFRQTLLRCIELSHSNLRRRSQLLPQILCLDSLPKYRRSHHRIFTPKFSRRIWLAEVASSHHQLHLRHEAQEEGWGRAGLPPLSVDNTINTETAKRRSRNRFSKATTGGYVPLLSIKANFCKPVLFCSRV